MRKEAASGGRPLILVLGVMGHVTTSRGLRSVDSQIAYPQVADLEREVLELEPQIRQILDIDLVATHPSNFQDGPLLFTLCETTGDPRAPIAISEVGFSRYGRLVTLRAGEGSAVDAEVWISLEGFLDAAGFNVVDPALLNEIYDGPFTEFSVETWRDRFFAPFY